MTEPTPREMLEALADATLPDAFQQGPPPTLLDRFRVNRVASFYSGTLTGAIRGVGSDEWEKQRALDLYDAYPQWETPLEAAAALAGQVVGQLQAPENYTPVGLGEKVLALAGIKSAPWAARFLAGAVDAGVVNAATDAGVQAIEIGAGQREAFDPAQFGASVALGSLVGGGTGALLRSMGGPDAIRDPMADAGAARPASAANDAGAAAAAVAPALEPRTVADAGGPVLDMAGTGVQHVAEFGLGDVLDARAREVRQLGPSTIAPPKSRSVTPGEDLVLVRIGDSFAHEAQPFPNGRHAFEWKRDEQGAAALPKREAKRLVEQMRQNRPETVAELVPVQRATKPEGEFLAASASLATPGKLVRDTGGVAGVADNPAFTRVKDIAEKLSAALEAPAVRLGRVSAKVGGQKAAGQYSLRSGVVRVARPDDFDTLTHELGHHLETALGKPLKSLMAAHSGELLPMAYAGAQKGSELQEGFAEFVRTFVTNPAYAAGKAPVFDKAFRAQLAKDGPELLAALDEAGAAWRAWLDQPSADAVASTIVSTKEPKYFAGARKSLGRLGLAGTVADYLSRAYAMGFDDLAPLNRAVKGLARIYRDNTGKTLDLKVADDAYKLARLSRGAYQAGHMDIAYGVTPYRAVSPATASLREALIIAMGRPNALSRWDDDVARRFGAYLWSRRALGEWERFARGEIPNPPDKLNRADHVRNIEEMEALHPAFIEAAPMVHEWALGLWAKKRDAGLITAQQYDDGLKIRDYVPGLRSFDQEGDAVGAGGRGGEAKGGFVKRFRGSRRDVVNPIESLVADAYETAMAIARNDVVKSLDRLALLAGPGGGAIAERIPSHQLRAMVIDPLEAIEAASREAGVSGPDAVLLRDAAEAAFGDAKATLFRPAVINEKGEAIAFYRDGGELKALRLADGEFGRQMYSALTMMTRHESNVFVEMLSKPAAVLRLGITAAPEFIIANFIRDQVMASIFYGKPLRRMANTFRGMRDEVFQAGAARAYNAAGGIMGGANVAGLGDLRARMDIEALKKKGWAAQRLTSVKGVLQMTELSETGMRLGLFRSFYDAAKERGLSDIEATLEAAWRARDHIDFDRRGSQMTGVARLVPFLNASLQGIDKTWRQMIQPLFAETVTATDAAAKGEAVKAWARLGVLTLAGMGLHALMSQHDEYNDLSPQTRATHWMVKMGDKWLAIPKPFEMGAVLNLGEAAWDAVKRRDPRWAETYLQGLYEVAMPPNVMEGNPLIASAYELASGVNLRSGQPVVPEGMEGMEPWLQFTARTSDFSKMLGKAINQSPAVIDHLITAHAGSMGRNALALYDYALSDKPLPGWDDMAITRRFIKDGSRGASSSTAFWRMVSTRSGTLEGARKTYAAMIEAGDPARAADYLAAQDDISRAWIAAGSVKAEVRRIHPFVRARSAVTAINDLRREMAQDTIRTADGEVTVSRVDRGAADDILEDLAMTEARNALAMMGVPGWQGREMIETATYFRELDAINPDLRRALADRFAAGKVLPMDAVERLWPEFEARLLRDGSDLLTADLSARAKGVGFELDGNALKRKPRPKVEFQ